MSMKKWASVEKKGGVYFIPMGPLVFNEQFPNSWMLDQCVSQNLKKREEFILYPWVPWYSMNNSQIPGCWTNVYHRTWHLHPIQDLQVPKRQKFPQVAFEPGRPTC